MSWRAEIVRPDGADGTPRCGSISTLPSGTAVQCSLLADHEGRHRFVAEWDEPRLDRLRAALESERG